MAGFFSLARFVLLPHQQSSLQVPAKPITMIDGFTSGSALLFSYAIAFNANASPALSFGMKAICFSERQRCRVGGGLEGDAEVEEKGTGCRD